MAQSIQTSDLATFSLFNKQLQSTQNKIFDAQKKATADFKNEHYYDMDPNLASQTITVENIIAKNNQDKINCEFAQSILYTQEESLKNLTDIINTSKDMAVQAINSLGEVTHSMIKINSETMLSKVQYELSKKCFNMNIWNGSRTNELPYQNNSLIDDVVGTNQYQGDDFNLKFYTNNFIVQFGNPGNTKCINDMIQGLKIMRDAVNLEDIQNATALLDKARDGITSLLQKTGEIGQTVISIQNNLEASNETLSKLYTDKLNGLSEEDRAMNLIEASAIQRRISYLLPIMVNHIKEMSIAKYL